MPLEFPNDWPPGCPPADAEDANGIVFRVVKHSPPEKADLLSQAELAQAENADAVLRVGVSVCRELNDAVHIIELLPYLGDLVARADLQPAHGKTKPTPSKRIKSHTTWWPYNDVVRENIFQVAWGQG